VTGLTFGVDTIIDLCSDEPIGFDGYIFEASSAEDGADWGNPDAVITEIQSQLLDGSLGKITSFGNRTATIPLRIYALNMDALANAEAVLMGEVYRDGWNQLVWTPPNASVSTVFDVVYADLQFKLDDLTEQRCIRNYTLTLTCLPRPRSADPVNVESLPTPPDTDNTVTVDDCTSATNWSSTTGSVSVLSGAAVTTSIAVPIFTHGTRTLALTRTASVDTTGTPFLVLTGTHSTAATSVNSLSFDIDGTTVVPISLSIPGDGTWSAVLYPVAPFSAVTVTAVMAVNTSSTSGTTARLSVANIDRSDQAPTVDTPRQQWRRLPVYGSARTEASLDVVGDGNLGPQTMIYTAPASSTWSPPLRPYRTGGPAVTTDSSMASGFRNTMATSEDDADTFTIPAWALESLSYRPIVLAAGPDDASAWREVTFHWSVSQSVDAYPDYSAISPLEGSCITRTPGDAGFFPLQSLELPLAKVAAGASSSVVLRLWVDPAEPDPITLDNVYLCPSKGRLSLAQTEGLSMLRYQAAGVAAPLTSYWVGDGADSLMSLPADRIQSWTQHDFEPGDMECLVVTPACDYPAVSMSYYPRWGHHAGSVPAS
jgi:hypothetical protein